MQNTIDFTKVLNKGDKVLGRYGWPSGESFTVGSVDKNYFSCEDEAGKEFTIDIHTAVGGRIEYDEASRLFSKFYSSTGEKAVTWEFPEASKVKLSKSSRGLINKLKENPEEKAAKKEIPSDLYTPAQIAEIYGWDGKKIRKRIRAKAAEIGLEKSDEGWALTKEQVKAIFGDIV